MSQAKEDTTELQAEKVRLEESQKSLESFALDREEALNKKVSTIGNYVDDSVPVSDNEVCSIA